MATDRRANRNSVRSTPTRAAVLIWLLAVVVLAVMVLAIVWLLRAADDATSSVELSQLRTPDFHALAINPVDGESVLYGHHGGVMLSKDGGRNWSKTSLDQPSDDAMGMAFSSYDPHLAFAAGHDTFFKSTDGGQNWTALRFSLSRRDIHGLAVLPGLPASVVANVVGLGLFRSDDAGVNWSKINQQGFPPDIIQLSAATERVIYAASPSVGIVRSDDGGVHFTVAARPPGISLTVATSAADPETVYVGTDRGLQISIDGGRTWKLRSVPKGTQVMASAVNPRDSLDLILVSVNDAGVGYVFRTYDGGASWTKN